MIQKQQNLHNKKQQQNHSSKSISNNLNGLGTSLMPPVSQFNIANNDLDIEEQAVSFMPPPFHIETNTNNEQTIVQNKTDGESLSDDVKEKMENSFQKDFSNVRIHTNSENANNLGALAYAQGNDIHFASGQYNPNSHKGQELIGHELTHVVQQNEGRVKPTQQFKGNDINDDKGLEAEANSMGKKVANASMQTAKLERYSPVNNRATNAPFQMFIGRMWRGMKSGAKKLGGSIKRGAAKVGSGIKKVGRSIGKGIKKVGNSIKRGVTKVGRGIKKAGQGIKRWTVSKIEKGKKFIKDNKETLLGIQGFSFGVAKGVKDGLVNTVTGIVDLGILAGKALFKVVKKAFTGEILSDLVGIYRKISTLSKSDFQNLALSFSAVIAKMWSGLKKKWNHPDVYQRWNFRGVILGNIIAEIAIAFLTSGIATAAKWLGKLGRYAPKLAAKIRKVFSKANDLLPPKTKKRRKQQNNNNNNNNKKNSSSKEQRKALIAAKFITEAHDVKDSPIPTLLASLQVVKHKYKSVKKFEVKPKSVPGHYKVFMLAKKEVGDYTTQAGLDKLGIKRLDVGGGLNSKYPDGLNIDPQAKNGFKGTLDDFIQKTEGKVKFNTIVVDNPRFSFLENTSKILEKGGTITVRGTMSNKFFNKIVNGKVDGLEKFEISNLIKISNEGFKTTTGKDIKGQMLEVILTKL